MEDPNLKLWKPHTIAGIKEFSVRIGPTGGKRGYTPITGKEMPSSQYKLVLFYLISLHRTSLLGHCLVH
jgi:hypothetical protein